MNIMYILEKKKSDAKKYFFLYILYIPMNKMQRYLKRNKRENNLIT